MKKQVTKTKFTYLSIGLFSLFIGQGHITSFWSPQAESSNRAPSSLELVSEKDPMVYSDFFGKDQKMRVEFWTNKNEDSIKKRSRLALHQALSKTLLSNKTEKISKDLFKKNLIESFSKSFLKSLYLLKVVNGTFQVDLHFEPSSIKDFNELMNSNQLIDQSETGGLLRSLEERSQRFEKKVLSRIPQNQEEPYHSLGGTITLWFKVLDLNLNSLDQTPNAKKNALKGFIKYRRYFSMKRDWSPIIQLSSSKKELKGQWKSENSPKVLTVDITNQFDLESLIPKPGKLEIFFGKIKHPKKYKTGFFKNLDIFSKDVRVNTLLLNGEDFSFALKRLEFDLLEQSFSQSSKILSHGDWKGFSLGQKRSLKSQTRRALLGPQATDLIKEFSLYRFEKKFKKVGGK